MTRNSTGGKGPDRDTGPPFESHRIYYVALKFAVLALAVWLAVRLLGLW